MAVYPGLMHYCFVKVTLTGHNADPDNDFDSDQDPLRVRSSAFRRL